MPAVKESRIILYAVFAVQRDPASSTFQSISSYNFRGTNFVDSSNYTGRAGMSAESFARQLLFAETALCNSDTYI